MRLTPTEREEFELAAALKDMTLTQWAVQCLRERAREDVAEETETRLARKAFDEFKKALDLPLPDEARVLLGQKRVWE